MHVNDKYKLDPQEPPKHVSFTVILEAKHEWASVRRLLKRLLRTYNLRCTRIVEDKPTADPD